ncbi:MAG: polysaccharide biosynthesis tyrosine autokinase [Planctomycetota bacterium]
MTNRKLQSSSERAENSSGEGIVVADVLEFLRRRWLFHAIGAAIGLAVALTWYAAQAPSYRAEATLRLEQQSSSGSLLSDLAALTQAPMAVSEMEILRSRTIAEAVVSSPPDGIAALAQAGDERDGDHLHLGLTTLVDDEGLRPSARLARLVGLGPPKPQADSPRLFADLVVPASMTEPPDLLVDFVTSQRVRISELGSFGARGSVEHDCTPGQSIEYAGMQLALAPAGDLTGRSFRLHYDTPVDAVTRVMRATRVAETDRNSGVIRIVYHDSDPVRGAATVNAMCRNYLARNQESSKRRASQTVDFIEGQLEEQIAFLTAAEGEVVQHKQQSPQFIDVGETAKALIQKLSELDVRRLDSRIQRASLEEAIALVDQGDLAALSRFGPEVADPVTASFIESIARLSAETELLDRTDSGAFKALLQQQLVELRTQRDAQQLKLDALRAIHDQLAAGDATVMGGLVMTSEAGTADPLMTSLVERWTALDSRVRELEGEFTDALPELGTVRLERAATEGRIVDLLAGRIAGLEGTLGEFDALARTRNGDIDALPQTERARIELAIDSLRRRTLTQLRSRLDGIDALTASVDREVQALEAELSALPESERSLAAPMRAVATHGEIVKLLLLRKQEAEITRAATIATAEFIDSAAAPQRPIAPSLPVHALMGLVLGLAVAAATALLREGRGSEIHTAAELEVATGLSVVGSIPDFRRGRTRVKNAPDHFVALRDDPEGPIAEAYRALRSNLKFIIGGSNGRKTLAITSCVPGEGKSVTNVDVALSFAMSGKRVLLVDADMRRPSVSRYLQIGPARGLSDVLRETHAWQDCLVPSCHENLTVLPSGGVPEAPGDLLAGARSRELIAELREAYDLVVFDVPPVLAVADIECLAPHVEAVLLLCRSSKLTDSAVRHAATRLRQVGANVVGAVLNAVVARGVTSGDYGYGYGYGYGTDGVSKRKKRAA